MISTEKLKKFILDMDGNVRREAGCYFYEGHIQDPQILPLTLQACQQYGFDECSLLLFYAQRQLVDDFTATKLLEIMRETGDGNIQMHLTQLLNNASISFLKKNIDVMPTQISEQQWAIARNRLTFNSFSAQQLWQALSEYSESCINQKVDASYYWPLVGLLAHHDYPNADDICELIEEDHVQGQWMELFLIQLAAARKIEQAIPIINKKLAEDDFYLSDTCSKALAEIGTEAVVDTLKEGCKSSSWGYQISASDILGRIKLPQSEMAIIELLENNKNDLPHEVYCYLCFGLCDLFSDKAFQYGKEVFDDIEAIEIDSMRERLITLSAVFGTPLSPETRKQWERKIALEPQRRKEYMRKKHPELYKISNRLRKLFVENDKFDEANSLDENISYNRSIESIGPKPAKLKIGRNEPCSCGSGKKYKKCCGK
jgi:hypothetical protein